MKRGNTFFSAFCALLLATAAPVGSAHHSTSEYDQTVMVEVEGTIVRKFWKNPHVMIELAVEVEGEEQLWILEGNSVSSQRRRGMTGEEIQVGDRMRAAGYVSTRRDYDMLALHVLLESGQELLLRGEQPPRWPDAQLVALQTGVITEQEAEAAEARAEGLFRVWTWGRLERGWWFFGGPDQFPLTQAAIDQQATWNEYTDNPQLECIAPGMPATMGNPYPIEFVQVGDNIEMRAEEFDVVRTIHMNGTVDPSAPHSPLGYSIGRWEGDELVVETSKINWQYFNRVGVEQSENVTTVERFSVDEAAGHLNYQLTVTDPSILTEPFHWVARWNWVPGEVVSSYSCSVE